MRTISSAVTEHIYVYQHMSRAMYLYGVKFAIEQLSCLPG